jgi:hypothetical protein
MMIPAAMFVVDLGEPARRGHLLPHRDPLTPHPLADVRLHVPRKVLSLKARPHSYRSRCQIVRSAFVA